MSMTEYAKSAEAGAESYRQSIQEEISVSGVLDERLPFMKTAGEAIWD